MMRRSLVPLLLVCFLTFFLTTILSADEDAKAADATKASGRVEAAGTVLDEIQSAPDQRIPEEILASADCVAVVPSLLNGGFVFGARYGVRPHDTSSTLVLSTILSIVTLPLAIAISAYLK